MDYKTDMYFRYGARLVWIFDPVRRVVQVKRMAGAEMIVTTLTEADTLTGGEVLPDVRLVLADVFGDE